MALVGDNNSYGYKTAQASSPYTLLQNPSHTINMGANGAVRGVRIVRQGLTVPSTLRTSINATAAFSGTAITQTGNDIELDHVTVLGFGLALNLNGDRSKINWLTGDNTAGIYMSNCGDTCIAANVEFWPYINSPYNVTPQNETSNISAVTNSGGLFEVTLSAIPTTPIVTGDTIVVGGVGGFSAGGGPNGRWKVTAIDTQHFTLNSSTYASGYTSAGTAFLTGDRRTGKGIEVVGTGSLFIHNYTEYGNDVSWHVGGSAYGNRCYECWFDGDLDNGYDPTPVGALVDGSAQDTTMSGSFVSSKAISLKTNISSSPHSQFTIVNSAIGATGVNAGIAGSGLQADAGETVVVGSIFRDSSTAPTNPFAYVTDGATRVMFAGVMQSPCFE